MPCVILPVSSPVSTYWTNLPRQTNVSAMIDLRSDTVTRPTAGMRRAIAEADVGDDALGDDPTVIRLEQRMAGLLGKEASLFFPSGIMANQVALQIVAERGTEVI